MSYTDAIISLSLSLFHALDRALTAVLIPEMSGPADRVFAVAGAARSNMAMAMPLRWMERSYLTVHGFRSTFCDWAGDATDFPRELIEHAFAHTIGDKAEAVYRRGKAIERRHKFMVAWTKYVLRSLWA